MENLNLSYEAVLPKIQATFEQNAFSKGLFK